MPVNLGNPVSGPLYVKQDESSAYQLLPETTAANVSFKDGEDLETKFASLSKPEASDITLSDGETLEKTIDDLREAVGRVSAGVFVVADISGRDGIDAPATGAMCFVLDASADPAIDSGAALYIHTGAAWVCVTMSAAAAPKRSVVVVDAMPDDMPADLMDGGLLIVNSASGAPAGDEEESAESPDAAG